MAGTDLSNDVEKHLGWLSRLSDKIRETLLRLLKKMLSLLPKGVRELIESRKMIGEKDDDGNCSIDMTLDDVKNFSKELEMNEVEHAFKFIDKEGKVIDAKKRKKEFRAINKDFRKAMQSKTHLEIVLDEIKKLNNTIENKQQKIKEKIAKGEISSEIIGIDERLSEKDIRDYDNQVEGCIIDSHLMSQLSSSGYRDLILEKARKNTLENDLIVSQNLNKLKESIIIENANKREAFIEKRNYILERYKELLDFETGEISDKNSPIHKADQQLIGLSCGDIQKVLSGATGYDDNGPMVDIFNEETNETTKISFLSEEYLRNLLVEEYNYRADTEYKTPDFKKNEIENDDKHNVAWSEFCEKYSMLPENRVAEGAFKVRLNTEKTYTLDGKESQANGKVFDKYTLLNPISQGVYFDKDSSIAFNSSIANYNKQLSDRAKKLTDEFQLTKEINKEEKLIEDKTISADMYLNEYKLGALNYTFGNVSNYKEFKEGLGENELIIQLEMSEVDARKMADMSTKIDSKKPIIARNDFLFNTTQKNSEILNRGSNSNNPEVISVTMPFDHYKKCAEKFRVKDVDSGKQSYSIQPVRARIFSDAKYIDEKRTNNEYIKKDMKMDGEDNIFRANSFNNDIITSTIATGLAYKENDEKMKLYAVLEGVDSSSPSNGGVHIELVTDKSLKENYTMTLALGRNFKEQHAKVSPENTREVLDTARIQDISYENISRNIKDYGSFEKGNECALSSNEKTLDCLLYNRQTNRFVKDENNEVVSLRIDKENPFTLPKNVTAGQYMLLPYEEYYDDLETNNKQVLELNPQIGFIEDDLSEENKERFISTGMCINITDDKESMLNENVNLNLGKDDKSNTENTIDMIEFEVMDKE